MTLFSQFYRKSKGLCFCKECTVSKESSRNIKMQISESGCLESAHKILAYNVVLFVHMVEANYRGVHR